MSEFVALLLVSFLLGEGHTAALVTSVSTGSNDGLHTALVVSLEELEDLACVWKLEELEAS